MAFVTPVVEHWLEREVREQIAREAKELSDMIKAFWLRV